MHYFQKEGHYLFGPPGYLVLSVKLCRLIVCSDLQQQCTVSVSLHPVVAQLHLVTWHNDVRCLSCCRMLPDCFLSFWHIWRCNACGVYRLFCLVCSLYDIGSSNGLAIYFPLSLQFPVDWSHKFVYDIYAGHSKIHPIKTDVIITCVSIGYN